MTRHMTRRGWIFVELLARALAVTIPVIVLLAVDGSLASWHGAVWAVVVTVVLLLSIQAGFSASAAELLSLGTLVAVARGALLGLVLVSALDLWLEGLRLSAGQLLLLVGSVFAVVTLVQSALRHSRAAGRRIIIVGTNGGVTELIEELPTAPIPFEVIGVVDDRHETSYAGVPVLGRLEDLPDVIERQHPDMIVVALSKNRPAVFGHLLDHASAGFRVAELAQFFEHAFGRVPVRDLERAWFMSVLHLYQRPYSRASKRVFDLLAASAGLLVMLPVLPVVALLVKLTRGPVILGQTRVGENDRPFTMYKFRTMRFDAEELGDAVWATDDDPRTTVVGRVMRRVRLDEVPQLWNVLRGEMSIVGPRPERPEFLELLEDEIPFWSRRQLVKPGITGWAQVRRGYTADTKGSAEKLSYDLWYLRHRSLLVDLAISVQTLGILVRGDSLRPATRGTRGERPLLPARPRDLRESPAEALTAVALSVARNDGSASRNGGEPSRESATTALDRPVPHGRST